MTKQAAYGTEPRRHVENRLDLDLLAQSESVFALSTGHIGLRGKISGPESGDMDLTVRPGGPAGLADDVASGPEYGRVPARK